MRCMEPPQSPKSLADAGLDRNLIADLVLRHLLCLGEFMMAEVAARVKLPISVVEVVLEEHRREKLIEIKGGNNYSTPSYTFRLTELGRRRGRQAMELCRYIGPAPVSLEHYRHLVERQTVQGVMLGEEEMKTALSHLVVNDDVRKRLGPAMISGHPVFIYGPSGNGKSSIAEAIGRALPENIYLPHAIAVGGQIITIFNPLSHVPVPAPQQPQDCDARWVLVKRPVIVTAGELSLKMLELSFDPVAKCYDASLQMKANNGVFIIDDFGRQQIEPGSILNRFMVPLERRVDHLTLHTGMNFVVPFDVLVIFFTDLEPKELVHDAFLRRLRYKIRIDRPSEEEYLEIFKAVCRSKGLSFCPEAYAYLVEHWYRAHEVARNACHPRDIIELLLTDSRYRAESPQLTLESIKTACRVYFGES